MMRKNTLIMLFTILCTFMSSSIYAYTDIDEYLYPNDMKRISMDFQNAPLNAVLKVFSQQSGMNFIASTNIANLSINLYLDNVPVEEAMERILSAHNLTYELDPQSNIFVVKQLTTPPIELITRVYPLKHATIPASKINTTLTLIDDAPETDTDLNTLGIFRAIESILSENGSLVEDPRTNSLIVTDIPSQFPMIESTIARLDVRIPQILIEVEMLDISKGSSDLLGAKFGNTPIQFNGAEQDGVWPFDIDNLADDNIADHTPGARDGLFEDPRYRVSTLSFAGLTFALNFLRTQSDTKSLARPRILTLNNETANIEISANEAIGVQVTQTSGDGIVGEASTEAERVETGVFLTVTPQANLRTNEITMAVEPRVIQARTSQGFTNAADFKDPEERGTRSILRIKDGDTIVLGGLLRSDISDAKTRVPVISKVPILGAAFRHKDKSESERELIIFITPHIVNEQFAANFKLNKHERLLREQDIPQRRLSEIQDELSEYERTGF